LAAGNQNHDGRNQCAGKEKFSLHIVYSRSNIYE
jgi:hypothetical protein